MTDSFSIVGTAAALLLPWMLGCTWLYCLLGRAERRNFYIVAGHGYLAGIVLTTLIVRLWDFAGLSLNFWGIAATLAILIVAACITLKARPVTPGAQDSSPKTGNWQRGVIAILLLLIFYRYWTIAQEIILRPLYPWDAWMNWAPKAITWYHLQELAPYISPADWLKSADNEFSYTTGARNAWKYPMTVPLIQFWGMLGAGASDQSFSNLPWLFAPLAFGLALYGHLRLIGASALLGTAACYLFLNIPYLSVHSSLAGYADMWLALAFGAAALSLHEWQQSRQWSWAVFSLFLAFACAQLKLPGLILGAIIVAVFLLSLINFNAKAKLVIAVAASACVLYTALVGISLHVPAAGLIEISTERIAVPHLGTFQLGYQPVHRALLETIFSMLNWNILWYLFIGLLIIKLYRKDFLNPPSTELQCLFFLLVFLFFIFYFTYFSKFVLDYSMVNRALLYAVPVMVFYIFRNLTVWNAPE